MMPPFVWFGGKRRIADMVWRYLGNPRLYIEPFAGAAAVLLARPATRADAIEIINDADHMVANYWRAVRADPDAVAAAADWPRFAADLDARHRWLMSTGAAILRENIPADPYWYDAQIAGVWWWCVTLWLGSGFAQQRRKASLRISSGMPHTRDRGEVLTYVHALADRLRHVRVYAADWTTCLTPAVRSLAPPSDTAVFLDPPYASDGINVDPYRAAVDIDAVVRWAREHGDAIRIVLCGYHGDYDLPGWRTIRWSNTKGLTRSGQNRRRETLYISPQCMPGLLDMIPGWTADAP